MLVRSRAVTAWINAMLVCSLLLFIPQTNAKAAKTLHTYTVANTAVIKPSYDVIVAGTDPEGIMAAVSAARNQLKVLLVENRPRNVMGGLMTLGWLNSLDLNKSPKVSKEFPSPYLNKGLFQEWYYLIGGTSFDVRRAANAFAKMVKDEKNIDVLMNARSMNPLMEGNKVAGMQIVDGSGKAYTVRAGAVIDATQDGDVMAAAGAPFTMDREDIGDPASKIAVTLVFKLSGVNDKAWKTLRQHKGAGSDAMSIWGYGDAKEYVSSDQTRVKIRSLNIGRQEDGTLLINTMQIYGIDPLDPASLSEGMKIGQKEAPLIVNYLKKKYKEFATLSYAGTAPELYVRESRHMKGEYRLTMADLMNNRDFWDAIAYGSYEVDIQSFTHAYSGAVVMKPKQYGVPFRTLVPQQVDGLLVVGRAASFDTLPHGSARVMPLGMATGQAAGAAVKLAKEYKMSFRDLTKSKSGIAELRKRLTKQGMDLRMVKFAAPEYSKHKYYPGLLATASLAAAVGGYSNDAWDLDGPSNPKRFYNTAAAFHRMFPEAFPNKMTMNADDFSKDVPLSLKQAANIIALSAGIETEPEAAIEVMTNRSIVSKDFIKGIKNPAKLTNGEAFMIVRGAIKSIAGVEYK
ncbi:FAD-dependent oxidoreductase [Cohnella suwonensis]|uniref:FAD-dependent oxidoreductase n=1 Tax=Cohnella suwonensis TaxID=696072 RepID=A0ABW0M2F7_9BACL